MDNLQNIDERRREKFAYLQNNALAMLLVSLAFLITSVYAHDPNLPLLVCNAIAGAGLYISWYFALKGKETSGVALAAASILLSSLGHGLVGNWHPYLTLTQSLSSFLVAFSLCLIHARR